MQILQQSGLGCFCPFQDPLHFGLILVFNHRAMFAHAFLEAAVAKVVGLTHQLGGLKRCILGEIRSRLEYPAAEFEILVENLVLQGDCVRGYDELPFLLNRLDDSRNKVGQALSDSCSGFKQQ
ncbi:MAG: hypothetical protein BWY82_02595 [Verrucomicrobia bacterium ADurb.Bin474]|nr:MAG: hypothetical protein BWY82_02595 [Verrucomicrobia bacterium ADurb.Bin474]